MLNHSQNSLNFAPTPKTRHDEGKPDILVCVDYPGFNMKLAAVAHELRIPALYYIAPTIWAWQVAVAIQFVGM